MKPSKFNVYVPLENGDILLYNSLSDRSALIDRETHKCISEGTIEDEDLKTTMMTTGFLVDDSVDELKIVRSRWRQALATNYAAQVGMTFIMTYSCNLSCTYCYEKGIRSLGGMMSTDTITEIVTFMRERIEKKGSVKRVVSRLYGGEPLLNWKGCLFILQNIEDMVTEYSLTKDVSLITNATLFSDEIIEEIASFGLEQLQITLDGCKEDHDTRRITPAGEGTYDTIVENINRLLDVGIVPEIRVNIDEKNYHGIGDLFDDLKEKGFDKVTIQVGIVSDLEMHCPSERISCLTPSSSADALPHIWEEAEARGFRLAGDPFRKPIYCQFDLLDFFVVDPFLNVYKCWDFIGMDEHRIGTLVKSQFIPEYPYYDATSRDITQFHGCRECDLLPLCKGSCAARAYDCFGTYHAAGCYLERHVIEQRLRWYLTRKMGENR